MRSILKLKSRLIQFAFLSLLFLTANNTNAATFDAPLVIGEDGARPTSVDDVANWKFWVESNGCEATIFMKVDLVEGWHIYSQFHDIEKADFTGMPTNFKFTPNSSYALVGRVTEPKAHKVKDEMGEHLWFEGGTTFKQKIKILNAKDFKIEFERDFQVCDEIGCLFPDPVKSKVDVKGCSAGDSNIEPVVDTSNDVEEDTTTIAVVDTLTMNVAYKGPIEFKMVAFRTNNNTFRLEVEATPDSSWYLVKSTVKPGVPSLNLKLQDAPNVTSKGGFEMPEGETLEHPTLGVIEVYKERVTFNQIIEVEDTSKLDEIALNFEFAATNGLEVVKSEEVVNLGFDLNKAPRTIEQEDNKSFWAIFVLAFVGGLLALLTPCVFPMIPMTVTFFTKQSKTKAQGIRKAIFYSLSIIGIYVILGVLVSAIFGAGSLNDLATNTWLNVVFFILFVVFAVSFFGAFEIKLPNSWINKSDKQADKGGLIGVFFMALTLALVSFSCTGPIVGSVLVKSAEGGLSGPIIAMVGFSLALALPFGLFAAFPGWLNSLPQSGGWLNTVKVVLGFLELAFALKFLSNADLVEQTHLLERELFIALWIGIFLALAIYLFGMIRFPHDSPLEYLSVGRGMFGVVVLSFVIYMIPGLWGAPLKILSGFPPSTSYSESPYGIMGTAPEADDEMPESAHYHGHGIWQMRDYQEGLEYARKVGKPVFLDFTGQACVNCRKMEDGVWIEEGINKMLKEDFVVISLFADERTPISDNQREVYKDREWYSSDMTYISSMWKKFQEKEYKEVTQPMYAILDFNENSLNGSANYQTHNNPADFEAWLKEGKDKFELIKDAEVKRPYVVKDNVE